MNSTRSFRYFPAIVFFVALTSSMAWAGSMHTMGAQAMMEGIPSPLVDQSIVGVQGYDLVSYRTNEKPLRGNGNHTVVHHGVTYLFINKENQEMFAQNPHKYLPAYGGYCAYGVAVGKKFVGDPDVWKIVDGRLFLNLDNKIQGIWNKDIPGYIHKAESHWLTIKDKKASDL